MKTTFVTVITAALLATATPSTAEQFRIDMIACVSKDLFNEAMSYVARGDESGFTQLTMSGRCRMLKAGTTVSVIDQGFIVSTIRYEGMKMFTDPSAIREVQKHSTK